MQSFRSDTAPKTPTLPIDLPSANVLVSLATAPLLGALVTGRTLSEWLIQVGVASEEIFRGTRLPVLNTRDSRPPQADSE